MPKPDELAPACTPDLPRANEEVPFFFFLSFVALESVASSKASGGFSGGGAGGGGGLGGAGIDGEDIHIINTLLGYRLRIRT